MLKIENRVASEEKDEFTAKNNAEDETLLHIPFHNENLIDQKQVNTHDRNASFDALLDMTTLVEDRAESHVDRSFADIKVPEVIVCFEEDAQQSVKDICIDDGSHTTEKFLLQNNDATSDAADETSSTLKVSPTNGNDDLSPRMKDASETLKQELSFSSITRNCKDQTSAWGLSDFEQNINTLKQVATDIPNPNFSLEQLLSLGEPDGDMKPLNSASFIFSTSHKQSMDEKNVIESEVDKTSFRKVSPKSGPTGANRSMELNDSPANNTPTGNLLEGFPTIKSVVSDAESCKQNNETKETHAKRVLECGITDPQVKPRNDLKESGTDSDPQHVQAGSVTEETAPDITTSTRDSFYQSNNYSELHLSGPSYLAGPKASSGYIAYSGSISIRSDSSTTSTCSFAFPILQQEWNSSPVRMAKADRRYIGKHRCLKSVLFCCKF